jgi:hypothetical protein
MAEYMTELSDAHQRVWSWDFCVTKLGPEHWAINLGDRSHTYEPTPVGPSASCFPVPHLIVFPGCWGCSCIVFFPCAFALLFQLFMFWATKYSNNQEFARVIRMDPLCPFCVKRSHVHFCPNVLVSSIRMEVRRFSLSLGLPFGCIVIENKFGHCNNNDWKILIVELPLIETFRLSFLGDRKNLVIKIMTMEISYWHLWDNRIFLITIYVTTESFWLSNCVG